MYPPRHGKSEPPHTVEPITWHQGWQNVAATAGEPTAETGRRTTGAFPERQRLLGIEHRVKLSTEPPVLMADGTREQQYLTASLEQHDDDGIPRVIIGRNETIGVGATLNEARRFALDILALVDQQDVSG